MRRKQPSIRCGRIDPRKRLAWPASLQLSLVLAAPAFSLARRKASASAPPPEGCCDLRGAEDVIDARELSRGMPCAGGSVLPPGSSSRRSVSANALAGDLDLQHFDFDDVARLYHLALILDEGLRHRRDVYQPILMHADIDEGAERRDVGYRAFEDHAGFQILQRLDALFEHRGLEGWARIAAGLFQLAKNVGHGRQAKSVIDEALRLHLAQDLRIADQRLDVALRCRKNPSHHRIGFRMNAGSVERVVAIRDPQEAGALFKRLRSESRYIFQCLARFERAVGVA